MAKTRYDNDNFPRWADFLSQVVVIYSLITFTLESEPKLAGHPFFYWSEVCITTIFAIEYFARLYLAQERLRYVFSLYGIIDALATFPMMLTFGVVDLRFARIIRLMRLLRLLKFIRYTEATGVLMEALRYIKGELIVFACTILGISYMAAVGIYLMEGSQQPEIFGSIGRSMWWAIVTLSTVGYGDTYPITAGGKVFAAIIIFLGIGLVAIPSGLLASALTKVRSDRELR